MQLEQIIANRGFLVGMEVSQVLHIDHAVFHDALYKHYRNRDNAPQILEYDERSGTYVPAVDPFINPLLGMQMYGTATYKISKDEIPTLEELFPNKLAEIQNIKMAFDRIGTKDNSQ